MKRHYIDLVFNLAALRDVRRRIPMKAYAGPMHGSVFRFFSVVFISAGVAVCQPRLELVAGGGPDHVPAREAAVGWPSALAVDSSGNLYVASEMRNRVFRVDSSG